MERDLVGRLETAVCRLEALAAGAQPAGAARGLAAASARDPAALAFEELVSGGLGRVSSAARKIGAEVADVTELMEKAFSVERELLAKTKQIQKPGIESLQVFMKPLNEIVLEANALAEGMSANYPNHLKAAAGSLGALAWIAYTGLDCGMSLPIAHVEERWQMAEFYNNKILVEYKTKDPDHVEWAKALKELYLPGLRDYVKSFYPLGPVWQTPGSTTSSAASPARRSAPVQAHTPSQPKSGMSAVFAEISSGKPMTQGLNKVTDDMKSKHRNDRAGVVSAGEKEMVNGSTNGSSKARAKLELRMGRKWVVEHHIGNKCLIIDDCDAKQSVYVFGCKDCVLQVKGKVNNITVDKCIKMGILFKDVVAACEIVNCNSVEVQCEGSAPTISIDNTSGCQLYLSKGSLKASITTAKSSEINALVPDASGDGDWAEHSLPQQFVHTFKGGQFTTSPLSHSGG